MIGLIVCGGQGSRLGPLGSVIQKALLPIAGRPAILGCVETLEMLGCDDVWLLAGHLSHQVREYFALEDTHSRVTVLDTATTSTTDAVRGVLDESNVDAFWYMHGDIALGKEALGALIKAHTANPNPRTGLIVVSREDKAPTHPHANVAGTRLVGLGALSESCEWCCVGIGRYDESMLLPSAAPGAFEFSLERDAHERIVPVRIGNGWSHLESLDFYREAI